MINLDPDAALAAHGELEPANAQVKAAIITIANAASGPRRHRKI
jgi:hypothetical protein